uniref:Uncharacterized protein n=1 Tax=Arundo donax TaxID=35708 RepID=A0A0A8Z995_ARUDO
MFIKGAGYCHDASIGAGYDYRFLCIIEVHKVTTTKKRPRETEKRSRQA